MSANRDLKVEEVKQVSEKLSKVKAFVLTGYRGLDVGEINLLRKKLKASEGWMKVVKNRLLERVLKDRGLEDLSEFIKEPTAVAVAEKDSAVLAKILSDFAKDHDKLDIRGGYFEGKKVNKADIGTIAKLPSREVLLSRALSSMLAPGNNLAGVLSAIPRKLVCAINAIKEKKSA